MAGPNPEIKAVISAQDNASAVLKAMADLARKTASELDKVGKDGIGGQAIANGFKAATSEAERHLGVLRRVTDALRNAGSAAKEYAKHTVLPVAGAIIGNETRKGVHQGADIEAEDVKNKAAGIPQADREQIKRVSATLAAQFPNVSRSQLIEQNRHLYAVLPHHDEVQPLMPSVARSMSVLNSIDPTGKSAEDLQFIFKGAELSNRTSPERFEKYIDSYIRSKQVDGKLISAEGYYEFDKYAKGSAPFLSDRFRNEIAPTLISEMGGSTAGNSIDQLQKILGGNFQNYHATAKEMTALGLTNAEDFNTTKTGELKGLKPGKHIAEYKLLQSDPDKWFDAVLKPALEKAGYTSAEDRAAAIRKAVPNSSASNALIKIDSQHEAIAKNAEKLRNAEGGGATETYKADPLNAFKSLSQSIETLIGTASNPLMPIAAKALSGLADGIGAFQERVAKWQQDNPVLAPVAGGALVAGGLAAGAAGVLSIIRTLFSGFGGSAALTGSAAALTGSSVALDASAAALTRAAVAVAASGGKGVPGAPNLPGQGPWGATPQGSNAPNATGASTAIPSALRAGGSIGIALSLWQDLEAKTVQLAKDGNGNPIGYSADPAKLWASVANDSALSKAFDQIRSLFTIPIQRSAKGEIEWPETDAFGTPTGQFRKPESSPRADNVSGLGALLDQFKGMIGGKSPEAAKIENNVSGSVDLVNRIVVDVSDSLKASIANLQNVTKVPLQKLGQTMIGSNATRISGGMGPN